MNTAIREFTKKDLPEMTEIWNDVVKDGQAFPQEEPLNIETAEKFFSSQSFTAIAEDADSRKICGLYILHPNNVGRCSHIANASYAVSKEARGNGIGKMLVSDSVKRGYSLGFKILQFNAVAADNLPARRLYEKLGFIQLGTIKNGFRTDDGKYKDVCPYYIELD